MMRSVAPFLKLPIWASRCPWGLSVRRVAAPEQFSDPVHWRDLHPAGHDPKARLAIQDEEGISAEVLYPSLGMVLCNHPDIHYKKACFAAYNRWLGAFCAADPQRLIGIPIISMRTPSEAVDELRAVHAQGFRGVMLPGDPAVEDYDHVCYDEFWRLCVELGMPVSFHILTTKDGILERVRGSRLVHQIVTVRGLQNIIMMMILGGVFDRHPKLQCGVCRIRCRVGAAFQVSDGSRVRATPFPLARRNPATDAEHLL